MLSTLQYAAFNTWYRLCNAANNTWYRITCCTTDFVLLGSVYVLRTILFADDHLLTANTEDDLQNMAHKLQLTATNFNMKISTDKTKLMAFCGTDLFEHI
jgi:hypothetical protein